MLSNSRVIRSGSCAQASSRWIAGSTYSSREMCSNVSLIVRGVWYAIVCLLPPGTVWDASDPRRDVPSPGAWVQVGFDVVLGDFGELLRCSRGDRERQTRLTASQGRRSQEFTPGRPDAAPT